MSSPCCLCAQIAGDRRHDLVHQHLGDDNYYRRLAEIGRDWCAIPSIGALVPGHTLLCPKQHLRSFASLDPDVLDDAATHLTCLIDCLTQTFGNSVQLFEHGNAKHGFRVACSVEHAHLHVVPGAPDLWPHIDRSILWAPLINGLAGLADAAGVGEYLLYRDLDGDYWIAAAPEGGIRRK